MMTREQLAEWLLQQNVQAIKASTGLSVKTIYRIRSGKFQPSYSTVQKLVTAGAKPPKRAKT